MDNIDIGSCYTKCNGLYSALDSNRLYCKKGCDADEETLDLCRKDKCTEVCIRRELGEGKDKKASWTSFFSRAPKDSVACMEACYSGCFHRVPEDD
ncbi:unnamed protein product [Moneuplotes crassus]|uniref:Uncharacterized protein n=1 Tax=Euplotes crassus TaxID=5936 RepID=A0AAD2D8Z9_EUPCR|nr:unnamed protein product [Moneuplotes crassus]